MNLYDILSDNTSLNITINAGQLIEAINYCVGKTRQELEQQVTDANTETYISIEQASKMLAVSKTTLWRWNSQDYLKPISIGGKKRYKMSDINKLMER